MADDPKSFNFPKQPPHLGANALRHAIHERGHWFCTVANDVTFEQVMTPSFWANHTRALRGGDTLRPFARVEVVREDGTMDLDLRVMRVEVGMVFMRVINKFVSDENIGKPRKGEMQAGDESIEMPEGYAWAHVPRGESRGHMVKLKLTGEVIAKGLGSKLEAAQKARAHAALANSTQAPPAPAPAPASP